MTRPTTGEVFYAPAFFLDVCKISPAGTLVTSTSVTGAALELWRVEWDEVNDQVILGKGGGFLGGSYLGTLSEDFLSQTETELLPWTGSTVEDVVMTEIDPDGSKIYYLACGGDGGAGPPVIWNGYGNDIVTANLPLLTSPTFFSTWHLFNEVNNAEYADYSASVFEFGPNTYNGIAVDANNIYTYDGDNLKKWNKFTGAMVDSVILGHPVIESAGIAVDDCGIVYVGTVDSVVAYDPSLNHTGGFPMTGAVIDIRINGSLMYVCGEEFLVEMTLGATILEPSLSATEEICAECDGTATSDTTVCTGYIFESILWSPSGATTLTATGLCSGWHVATINFINGTDTLTFIDSVEVNSTVGAVTCDESFTNESCAGANDGTITLTATSGASPWTYDIATATNTTGIFTGLPPATYDITVTDDNGCVYTSTLTILAGSDLLVDIDFTDETCEGLTDGTITLTPSTGSSPYNFDIGITSNTTGDFTGLGVGTYTITVTDDNGCTFNGSVTLVEGSGINLNVVTQNDPTCFGFTDGSVTVETLGGTPTYTYTWSPTNPVSGATFNNLGDGTVTVSVVDASGCTDTLVIVITEPPALYADLSLTHPLCNGDTDGTAMVDTVYNAQGDLDNITYIWNPDPASVSGVGADSSWNMPAGTYVLTINDDNGCSNEFTFEIIEAPPLVFVELGYDPAFCRLFSYQSGNGVVFAAAGGGTPDYTYEWENLSTGATTSSTTWGALNPGDYQITVTDDAGCVLTQIITLDSLNPIADFIVNSDQLDANLEGTEIVEAFFTNTSQNFSNPNDPLADTTFYWNLDYNLADWYLTHDFFEILDTIYFGERVYEVCLVAQNKNGCTDTTCKSIIVHAIPELLPPNIFTPDGDGINDVFTFDFKSTAIVSFNCLIVNRWGNKMTEITAIADGWNGKDSGGKECPDGVYFYTYQAESTNGTAFDGQGTVQLVRKH